MKEQALDLPDFLHNSPYLPTLGSTPYEWENQPPQPKPTIRQILRSKPARIAIIVFLSFCGLLYMRSYIRHKQVLDRLTGPACFFKDPIVPTYSYMAGDVDWSKYAYALYATDAECLCNAVMLFEILHRLSSRAERLLLYPNTFVLDMTSPEAGLLLKARDMYGVKLAPVQIQHVNKASYPGPNWAESYTKLLAFNQTQYERVVVLDSDSTILQTMDELFFIPEVPAAMPHAYWLSKPTLSSHIMVIKPSTTDLSRVETAIKTTARKGVYDMEIMNRLYGKDCVVLPHRQYALLTGEFRSDDHKHYHDGEDIEFNPEASIDDAKFVHFSDHPLPKPWEATEEQIAKLAPQCVQDGGWLPNCKMRDIWLDLYNDFRSRRQVMLTRNVGFRLLIRVRGYVGEEKAG